MLYNKDGYYYSQDCNIGSYNPLNNNNCYNFNLLAHKEIPGPELLPGNLMEQIASTNSTIDGDSPLAESDVSITPDGTRAPANRRDPIYTAVPGLKWKSKSKKWVVRWDNPITNRRVYKYFSGQRYGFIGAHKRAAYYLEFLNASIGKGAVSSGDNPFCRRNEGPPKGKSNKGLQRKYRHGNQYQQRNSNYLPDYLYDQSNNIKYNIDGGNANRVSEVAGGMMDILSVENLSNHLLNDVQHYINPDTNGSNDQNADKRVYNDYPEMFNNWNAPPGNEDHNIGMMNYPTYIYNPNNYMNQFTDYDVHERYYQPLPYMEQINPNQLNSNNSQYQSNDEINQRNDDFCSQNAKDDPNKSKSSNYSVEKNTSYQTPIQGNFMNYSATDECQTPFQHQVYDNMFENIDYYNLSQLNTHPTDNLSTSIAPIWNSTYLDHKNMSCATMQKNNTKNPNIDNANCDEKRNKRMNTDMCDVNSWKILKRSK